MPAASEWTGESTCQVGHPGRVANAHATDTPTTQGHAAAGQAPRRLGFWSRANRREALKLFRTLTAAGFVAAAAITPALAADISGAGATFPYPIYAKWADAYKKETGIGLNYQSIGSGGGIKQIQSQDRDVRRHRRAAQGRGARQGRPRPVPDGHGRHRAGRQPRRHQAGRTRHRRPDARQDLPRRDQDLERSGDHRSSTRTPSCRRRRSSSCIARTARARPTISPTTSPRVSADWKSKVGFNTSVEWPVGIGAKGNEGVANNVAQTKGSIGYVEYAYAKQNKLTHTKMINKDGKTVAPTSATFQAAAANANWNSVPGYGVILANQPGAESWPMTAATWILMYKTAAGYGGRCRGAQVLRLGL